MNSAARALVLLAAALALCVLAPVVALGAKEPSRAEQERIKDDVSGRVMCPSCGTTLKNSDSPAADRMRAYIDEKTAEGWSSDQIVDGLVVEYGGDGSILAAPAADTRKGALAWGVPLVVALVALVAGALSVRRWRRAGRGRASTSGASAPD